MTLDDDQLSMLLSGLAGCEGAGQLQALVVWAMLFGVADEATMDWALDAIGYRR